MSQKTFYSNTQYNPISLCIKGLITASKPTSDQMLRSNFDSKEGTPPSQAIS